MDKVHFEMLQGLRRCTFMPGSWDKRFVRDLASKPEDAELTEKQQEWVEKMAYKYRRQVGKVWTGREPERIYPVVFQGTVTGPDVVTFEISSEIPGDCDNLERDGLQLSLF
jgi:hypothetical protein